MSAAWRLAHQRLIPISDFMHADPLTLVYGGYVSFVQGHLFRID